MIQVLAVEQYAPLAICDYLSQRGRWLSQRHSAEKIKRRIAAQETARELFMDETPRVFLSHASEDKERFVLDLERRLRDRGVNVWLDRREMLPGDSLVDKIFTEGIGRASVVIVVLSQYSVDKPWVKEELNAAVVRRINTGSKLIPVVLDNCDVPEALKATVWERVENLSDYESSFDRIVAAVFGHREKPGLGPQPIYTNLNVIGIPGLSKIDFLVLQEFSRQALETGNLLLISTAEVWEGASRLGISREDFRDSCVTLCDRFMLEQSKKVAPNRDTIRSLSMGSTTIFKAESRSSGSSLIKSPTL